MQTMSLRRMGMALAAWGLLLGVAAGRGRAEPGASSPSQVNAKAATGADNIAGVVTSSNGPEAGVWVIAETSDLGTKFRKIVVTNDRGQYLLPDLPKAKYKVWVRGYGLVDSQHVDGTPGQTLALTAVITPSPRAAAEYYPASYWISLLKLPPKSDFPMTIPPPPPIPGDEGPLKLSHTLVPEPGADKMAKTFPNQTAWLDSMKSGCWGCHQIGNKPTRELSASLGTFKNSTEAWERALSAGQDGRTMIGALNATGHDRTLAMYADWTDRIANGELPPVPPRPQGLERNLVVTMWDWSARSSLLHSLVSTDRLIPSMNGSGPVFGSDWSAGSIAKVDPLKNTKSLIPIPLRNEEDRKQLVPFSKQSQITPSAYFGNELAWNDPLNPGSIAMDKTDRVWVNVETRIGNPDYCKAGSSNSYAQFSPREFGGKGLDVYDPKTGKFEFVDLCVRTERIVFADDKDQTIYIGVKGDGGIGWLNTRVWDETHDAEKSQGWCPPIIDYNQDGKIGEYTKAPQPVDPKLDRAINSPGANNIAYNPVDGSLWLTALAPVPGRLIRVVRGSNPPASCVSEVYEPPSFKEPGYGGTDTRGIDIDSNGLVWTPLTAEGNLASFDRRKCKTLTGELATTGRHCSEGWSFYAIPGATFKTEPDIKSDWHYNVWVDRFNTFGLGNNTVIVAGTYSDSLLALEQDSKRWVRLTVPYPMGFYTRPFDGRIDNASAGWKGRGVWAANNARGTAMTEGGDRNTPSTLAHFQMRPDPLAK